MKPHEKLINVIKDGLIAKHGYNFLKLSEKDLQNLILQVMRDYMDNIKK